MTDSEIKVWRLFIEEVSNNFIQNFSANESMYRENVTLALIMLENTVLTNSSCWKLKLKSQSSYGIPSSSVDEFVDIMSFNAIRKMKTLFFK
ncbi:MAG: hypothetical protein ACM3MI_08540 [Clostridiales bacterium]